MAFSESAPVAALTVVGFILSAFVVVFAGVRLARHGDVIAARSRQQSPMLIREIPEHRRGHCSGAQHVIQ